jgi:hypothetical protein
MPLAVIHTTTGSPTVNTDDWNNYSFNNLMDQGVTQHNG